MPRFHSYSAVAINGPRPRCFGRSRASYPRRTTRSFGAGSEVVFKFVSTKAFQRFSPLSVKSPNFTIPVIAVRLSSSMQVFILLAIIIVKHELIFDILPSF